jgi:hypothetical protein
MPVFLENSVTTAFAVWSPSSVSGPHPTNVTVTGRAALPEGPEWQPAIQKRNIPKRISMAHAPTRFVGERSTLFCIDLLAGTKMASMVWARWKENDT